MNKFYHLFLLLLISMNIGAQDLITSHALAGTCIDADAGEVHFIFDLNQNCPEADVNGVLPGTQQMGFHSGANDWASIIEWNAAEASILENNGADSFLLTVNIQDYYDVAFEDLTDIQIVINNGFEDPDDPWTIAFRDSLDGEAFGNAEPCSNLKMIVADIPTCADLNQGTSLALFSDAADSESCVDAATGRVKLEIDYALVCPEGDPGMLLAGQQNLALHSGINSWATTVEWDAAGAAQLSNDGSDNFSVVLDVQSYYGTSLDEITDIQVIGNNGLSNAAMAWDNALKDPRDGGFGGSDACSDLILIVDEAPQCDLSTGVENVVLKRTMKISPNPFQNRAFIEFDNPENQSFDLVISDMTGRIVRTMNGIEGERVLVERENLPAGIYTATLQDDKGDFATSKMVIK